MCRHWVACCPLVLHRYFNNLFNNLRKKLFKKLSEKLHLDKGIVNRLTKSMYHSMNKQPTVPGLNVVLNLFFFFLGISRGPG